MDALHVANFRLLCCAKMISHLYSLHMIVVILRGLASDHHKQNEISVGFEKGMHFLLAVKCSSRGGGCLQKTVFEPNAVRSVFEDEMLCFPTNQEFHGMLSHVFVVLLTMTARHGIVSLSLFRFSSCLMCRDARESSSRQEETS